MRIVYFGTGAFGLPTLRALLGSGAHQVAAIVTGPDQPQGRGRRTAPSPIADWAAGRFEGPILKPQSTRDPDLPGQLARFDAHAFVVVAYRILPESVYAIPRNAINLHASLLPKYRGAAPIQRAIMAGETRTGVTTFVLQQKVDSGGVLLQREIEIGPEENAGELAERLAQIGAEVVTETLNGLAAGTLTPKPQDTSLATPAPKITPTDRVLDFASDARGIVNRVRGLAPKPAAVAMFRGSLLKILAAADTRTPANAAPGEIVTADPKQGLTVAAGGRLLELRRVQPEGKSAQSGAEFVRGYRIEPGERLTRASLG